MRPSMSSWESSPISSASSTGSLPPMRPSMSSWESSPISSASSTESDEVSTDSSGMASRGLSVKRLSMSSWDNSPNSSNSGMLSFPVSSVSSALSMEDESKSRSISSWDIRLSSSKLGSDMCDLYFLNFNIAKPGFHFNQDRRMDLTDTGFCQRKHLSDFP